MGFFTSIVALIVLALSVVLSVAISQPFTGALVRLRANYLPKAVSLDNVLEDGAEAGVRGVTPSALSGYFLREQRSAAKIGPVVGGILSMLIRTRRLEGMPGIYKGSAPVMCQLLLLGFCTLVLFDVGGITGAGGGAYRAAPSGPGHFGFWGNLFFMIITSIVALPLSVITNRAIVHPRILTFRNVRENLRELLSYAEYSQPWRLYRVPGLLSAQLLHIFWIGFVTRVVRHITAPTLGGLPASTPAAPGDDTYSGPSSTELGPSTFGLAVFLAWCVLSVVVLSPLECVIVRLSVQRPERQQPLHMAYARVGSGSDGAPPAPAPYNNQAQAVQGGGVAATAPSTPAVHPDQDERSAPVNRDRSDPAPRPSFAIEDDDDDDEGEEMAAPAVEQGLLDDTNKNVDSNTKPAPPNGTPSSPAADVISTKSGPAPPAHRTLGGVAPSSPPSTNWHRAGDEPTEPVIALRPCDEPLSAEEAARAEAEGFGAPTVERYQGMMDCLNKLVDEEGIEALYRGSWVTLLGMLAGSIN